MQPRALTHVDGTLIGIAGMEAASEVWTVVVAGGSGQRFGGHVPKQFLEVRGKSVLEWSISAARPVSHGVVVVLPANDQTALPGEIRRAVGGDTRSASVRAGLAAVPLSADVIVVHDAARPTASFALFERVVAAIVAGADAATPGVAVTDTIRGDDGALIDRSTLTAVQTPQAFDAISLRAAHVGEPEATDDVSLIQARGGSVTMVEGERWNIKLTEPADLAVIEALLGSGDQ